MTSDIIRNFCIIAHIDHGKSTLADRLLEVTGTVEERRMREQYLDQMDLERERGITIKLQPVRMEYVFEGVQYVINLIDTPGHVDFTYEVSRSLAAVEGAILLVDATQGIQAQTLANLYLALDQDLTIIPVVNKIDLPNAYADGVRQEIVQVLGCDPEDVLFISAKTGQGVDAVLDAVIQRVPPPSAPSSEETLTALIFDSVYDEYMGVIAYVRLMTGSAERGDDLFCAATGARCEAEEVGFFRPQKQKGKKLRAGEIGYIATGLKDPSQCRVGDTILLASERKRARALALPGYREVKPMVFAGLYPSDGDEYERLRDAMEKMHLTDSALTFEPDASSVLGFGFRCGFLGLLHMEIVRERLEREYDAGVIVTSPSVEYRVSLASGEDTIVHSPQSFPDPSLIDSVQEPWVSVDIFTQQKYIGPVMDSVRAFRGEYDRTEYLDTDRLLVHVHMPLSSILVDFYDTLKRVTSGYASMSYQLAGYRPADVQRMDILIAEEPVPALAMIVYKDEAYRRARVVVKKLKEIIPRQQFVVKIQAAIGGKIIAAERLSALRKDVTAKLYGGDVTRKRKLLEKQKKGKKKMMRHGKVSIPHEAYLALLKK